MITGKRQLTRREVLIWTGGAIASARLPPGFAVGSVDIPAQPYFASVNRALEALEKLGAPMAPSDAQRIGSLAAQGDSAAVTAAEGILERYTIANLSIESETSARVMLGGAPRTLVEQGWRVFLVRVANSTGLSDSVWFSSGWFTPGRMNPTADSGAQRSNLMDTLNKGPLIEKMWLMAELYGATSIIRDGTEIPVVPLSGISVEYHLIQLYSRDHGQRRADLTVYTLPKSGDGFGASGHREFTFDCLPSRTVDLGVLDTDSRGCVAGLTIKDQRDHVYPPQAMRLAPDMFFQSQIYRGDGETIRLPDGDYTVEARRGPEYLVTHQPVKIDANHSRIEVRLKRWIDPAKWGWYSGDTHIHAAGCAHYAVPTEGVSPETMIRHVRGEALSIGDVRAGDRGGITKSSFSPVRPKAQRRRWNTRSCKRQTMRPGNRTLRRKTPRPSCDTTWRSQGFHRAYADIWSSCA